jgi:hypothetical protein
MTIPNSRPIYTLPTYLYQGMVSNADAYGNKDGVTTLQDLHQFGSILGFYANAYGQAAKETTDPQYRQVYQQVATMLTRDWYVTGNLVENYGRFANASKANQGRDGITAQDVTQFAVRDRDGETISEADFRSPNPYLGPPAALQP